ncbi:putative biogenesis of lysosome-related organelles complex 1 subunit 6-like [Apostichopus japonicus]|uniref:Putative biogenesis of lysosome-related organelles complex 1 subunit 6-like n=1 Tax=Stichopus japonicus TaxID=307972 RepID=A0A2G8LJ31_STIJA|nr:putative biogenesis of lysosome-related organelles complex 1 subunit 6-like [Apostichopus japonicus]
MNEELIVESVRKDDSEVGDGGITKKDVNYISEKDDISQLGQQTNMSAIQEENAGKSPTSLKKSTMLPTPVSEETITTLSRAFMQAFQPHFENSKESLHELIRNQELLLDTVQQENQKYEENHMLEDVDETMKKARLYQTKLVNIRKEMIHLHERVGKLKSPFEQRMKENLHREQQKEREYEEDRLLKARPASSQPGQPHHD